jgi:SAM-dependent methyltransferase
LESEFVAPLEVVRCNSCSLIQITETIPPEKLFKYYHYFSSFSETMLLHAKRLTCELITKRRLGQDSLVVEVASNDGYLLKNYKEAAIPILGIEPAENVAALASKNGIETMARFFNKDLARTLADQGKEADVIHAHNVLAHVPEINDFMDGISILLKPEGLAIVEVPYAVEMIDRIEFDTIYHEHVFYYTLTSMKHLCERAGLRLLDVERIPIHGGSLRVSLGRSGQSTRAVEELLKTEEERGFNSLVAYEQFVEKVVTLRKQLVTLLQQLKRDGHNLAAYGAAAKGSTLLNYFEIGRESLDFVVDRSTAKQGHFMPGVHLPILCPSELLIRKPDYVLLLTWNFADEIIAQQADYLALGGKFIVPVPRPRIISSTVFPMGAATSVRSSV